MNDRLIISKLNEINTKLDKIIGSENVKPPAKKVYRYNCISEELYNKFKYAVESLSIKNSTKSNMINRFNTYLNLLDINYKKYQDLIDLNSDNYKLILDLILDNDETIISSKRTDLGLLLRSIKIIYEDIDNLKEVISRYKYYYKVRLLEIEHNKRPDVISLKTESKPDENIEPETLGLEFINSECIF